MGNTNCTSPTFNESGHETTGISFQSYLDEKNKSVPQVGHIKLLSYNIFVRPPMISNSGNDYKDQRLEEFTKFFHGYDIICLQEMFSSYSTRRKELIQKAEEAGFLFSTESPKPTTLSKQIIDGGLLILSRYPIAATEYCPYPAGHGSDHYVNKGVLYAKVQIGNSHLHVYTTHAQATYDTTAKYFLKRTQQFMCFRKFIKATLAKHQYCDEDLVLLAGDFNVNGREHSKFHSKDTSVLSVLKQFSSLRKGHIFSEYDALISCLTDDHTDEIDDLLYIKYGEHPITLGDYYVTNWDEKLPKDRVLTHPDLFCVAESLDYIFKYTPNAHSLSNISPQQQLFAKPKLYVKEDSVAVEKFLVTGQDFGQLSDHYGTTVTIEYTHGECFNNRKEAETAASTPSHKYSLSEHFPPQ